jgi:hypothetical protein
VKTALLLFFFSLSSNRKIGCEAHKTFVLCCASNGAVGGISMATLHFDCYPSINNDITEEEVKGRFNGWRHAANYSVSTTIILQIDTTNVTPKEYAIAPNITYLQTNQAIINIYKQWSVNNVSFSEFQNYYSEKETSLVAYVEDLLNRLNSARHEQNMYGEWFINYSLDERHISISKPFKYSESEYGDSL